MNLNNSNAVLSVKQLNFYVKSLIECDAKLMSICVCGEISNFKRHFSSGHCYFTLKDEAASVKCVMFKTAALRVPFDVCDGLKVICKGRVSLYEKDGNYQFYCDSIEPDGVGSKALALEQLKQKLALEGLFDAASKRKLPAFPKKVAVLTSGSGAALQDIINVIGRRYPICELIVASVSVQGEKAVAEIVNMLNRVYKIDGIDTIILGRGGGSAEDLDAFNSEKVARTVYESPFPIISAVGHETDFTVCDLVADMRAPTPSAAAELSVPDLSAVKAYSENLIKKVSSFIEKSLDVAFARLTAVNNLSVFRKPETIFEARVMYLDKLFENIKYSFENVVNAKDKLFVSLVSKVNALSPLNCLARGYSVVYKNEKTLTDVNEVNINDELNIRINNGKIVCNVTNKEQL